MNPLSPEAFYLISVNRPKPIGTTTREDKFKIRIPLEIFMMVEAHIFFSGHRVRNAARNQLRPSSNPALNICQLFWKPGREKTGDSIQYF